MEKKKITWMEEEFHDLDRDDTYAVDRSNMYSWLEKIDKILSSSLSRFLGKIDTVASINHEIREVLVCGMGGSAIAGDVAWLAVQDMLPVPYRVIKGYSAPASLGPGSLQIVVSYSGNTEESIWAYTQGHNRGADVVAITSGGALAELASHAGRPCVLVPPDCPAPRLALGYLLTAVLAVLDRAFDEIHGLEETVEEAVVSLKHGIRKYEKGLGLQKNIAKRLAADIHGAYPVIIGSDLTWPAALRFQTQLNENSKWPCHATRLPEMNHNEIVAYSNPGPAASRTGIVMLRDKDDHPRVQLRQDFTVDMIENTVAWVRQLKGEGKNAFARVCNLLQAADFTSYYLACGRGIDPMDIAAISILKEHLGKVK